ncbi:enolase C-terminal domain-like protein [Blattabacterium cuenoti]|uniref:enolase C-terminal domain-like protein n=1 Tax=Blattabacterium cuenoti TaxID=1653831 RepID=UPI00163BE249|nr:enolase C-terminal domain-like protein [Blattabacterium cuenoti]
MFFQSIIKKKLFFFKEKIKNSNRIFEHNIIWFLILKEKNKRIGIGECNPLLDHFALKNLYNYEKELLFISKKINRSKKIDPMYYRRFISYSSIFFGLEQAFLSFNKGFPILYNSDFTDGKNGLPTSSLIWLNTSENEFFKKVEEKIYLGFSCIKIKISSKLFPYQYFLLKKIKKKYNNIKIRIDANGSFKDKKSALDCINKLFDLNFVYFVEQPITPGNWNEMAYICKNSKLPIALDEELTTINQFKSKFLKEKLLDFISPQYIVLKPSICGGFLGSKKWILEAKKRKIEWYISSSLESNIGMNAITQWTFNLVNDQITHGLETGSFYMNNFLSPLQIKKGSIWYNPFIIKKWKIKNLI